jgi:hypothetical protein
MNPGSVRSNRFSDVLGIAHSLGVDRAELQEPIHRRGGGDDLNKKGSDMNGQRDLEGIRALVTGATPDIGKGGRGA